MSSLPVGTHPFALSFLLNQEEATPASQAVSGSTVVQTARTASPTEVEKEAANALLDLSTTQPSTHMSERARFERILQPTVDVPTATATASVPENVAELTAHSSGSTDAVQKSTSRASPPTEAAIAASEESDSEPVMTNAQRIANRRQRRQEQGTQDSASGPSKKHVGWVDVDSSDEEFEKKPTAAQQIQIAADQKPRGSLRSGKKYD